MRSSGSRGHDSTASEVLTLVSKTYSKENNEKEAHLEHLTMLSMAETRYGEIQASKNSLTTLLKLLTKA